MKNASPFKSNCVLCILIIVLARIPNDAAVGWFYYQQGMVKTKVDGAKEYRAPYYPVGYDLLAVESDIYYQIGIDLGGRFLYDVSTMYFESLEINKEKYGLDESFCNLKGGTLSSEGALAIGYGLDLDWRTNKYRENSPLSTFSEAKIRVGAGPNLAVKIIPHPAIVFFPNLSGYFYPWPNKDFSLLPKAFDSFGYRLEAPIMIDIVRLFTISKNKFFVFSAMPFMGSKSGFYKFNDQTNVVKDASASVYGVKFGAYWNLEIFTFMWKD